MRNYIIGFAYVVLLIFIIIIVFLVIGNESKKNKSVYAKLYRLYSKDSTYKCNYNHVCKKTEEITKDNVVYSMKRELHYSDSIEKSYYQILFESNNDVTFNFMIHYDDIKETPEISVNFTYDDEHYIGEFTYKDGKENYTLYPTSDNNYYSEKYQQAYAYSVEMTSLVVELIDSDLKQAELSSKKTSSKEKSDTNPFFFEQE